MVDHTPALRADHTEGVSLVNIHDRSVFLGCLDHRRKVGNVARHAENSIHDDQATGILGDSLQSIAKGIDRIMTVGNKFCRSHLTTLDDRGVILSVAEDEILGLGQRGKGALIRKEAGGKKKGAFAAKESRQCLLEFVVEGDRAVEQP